MTRTPTTEELNIYVDFLAREYARVAWHLGYLTLEHEYRPITREVSLILSSTGSEPDFSRVLPVLEAIGARPAAQGQAE